MQATIMLVANMPPTKLHVLTSIGTNSYRARPRNACVRLGRLACWPVLHHTVNGNVAAVTDYDKTLGRGKAWCAIGMYIRHGHTDN